MFLHCRIDYHYDLQSLLLQEHRGQRCTFFENNQCIPCLRCLRYLIRIVSF